MRTIRRSLAWLWPLLLAASPVGACDRAGFVIALDPGHTRANPGATSARGVPEVQFNAQLAEVVLRALRRAGFEQAFLTVEDQGPITLPGMVGIAVCSGSTRMRGSRTTTLAWACASVPPLGPPSPPAPPAPPMVRRGAPPDVSRRITLPG